MTKTVKDKLLSQPSTLIPGGVGEGNGVGMNNTHKLGKDSEEK